jgi:uncharacterized protein (DUF433 family)
MTDSPRVVTDPHILGGTPVFEGTRVPADQVLAELRRGTSEEIIRRHYPSLPPGALGACVEWEATGRPVNAPDPDFVRTWPIPGRLDVH